MGEDLGDLSIEELRGLEQKMDASLGLVRERKVGYGTSRSQVLGWSEAKNISIGLMDP